MGSENRFVYNPSTVDISRSKFQMNSFWKGSIYHGDLVPVEVTRIIPGDSAIYDLAAFIRTATPPIAPFMDTIKLNFAAFYVPDRLVWSKTKEFYGENTEGYGVQSEVLAPRSTSSSMSVTKSAAAGTNKRSFAAYLGLVRQNDTIPSGKHSPVALNPIRVILQCYNDWFRNENFMPPYLWDHSQTGDAARIVATLGGVNIVADANVPQVCKQLDRYTSCLPWAQKGSPVLLPLGETAPVVGAASLHSVGTSGVVFEAETASSVAGDLFKGSNGKMAINNDEEYTSDDNSLVAKTNLVTDLSAATAASVNQLRLAFATQRYLEALARSGSKYREYIKGMFGVNIGDTTAQMAEYLGGFSMDLNIDQVLQTTDYAAGTTTKLGAPGASSTSAGSNHLFTKSFTEPGYLIIFAYTKHNRTYGQGIDDIYFKHELLEEYNPKFANVGEEALKKSLLYWTGNVDDDDTRFGFQEKWSEYRHKKDFVCAELCPSNTGSFNFWSLADSYSSAPALNADFLKEDRDAISRVLAGGSTGPDYFLDIKFSRTFVRPMPLYSIPGLIDHH